MKPKTLIAVLAVLALTPCSPQTAQAQSWNITGNGNTTVGTNFVGTTNNTGLSFRTNKIERMRITGTGNLGIGLTSGFAGAKLQVANGGLVSLSTPGHVVLGLSTGVNLALDDNEVQARNNGSGSTLYLNYWGGAVWIGRQSSSTPARPTIYADAAGHVGIGTADPQFYALRVTGGSGFDIQSASSGNHWVFVLNDGVNGSDLDLNYNGNFTGFFRAGTGEYFHVSDERLKTNIRPMGPVLAKVSQLNPSTYEFRNGDAQEHHGFIAQEVMQIFPALVAQNVNTEGNVDVYSVNYSGFGVIAIKAIQEQQQTINEQQQRITKLEERLTALEDALGARK